MLCFNSEDRLPRIAPCKGDERWQLVLVPHRCIVFRNDLAFQKGFSSYKVSSESESCSKTCSVVSAPFCLPGYLVGFISHRKHQDEPVNCSTDLEKDEKVESNPTVSPAVAPAAQDQMDWKDVTQLLEQKLTSQAFDKTLRYAYMYKQTHLTNQTNCSFIE